MAFNPSDYGWTDQDVLNSFVNDPEGLAQYAKENNISANDLADWANTVEGTTRDWTADKINQLYGINYAPVSTRGPIQLYQPNTYPSSYTGIDKQYLDQIMQAVIPEFKKSITGLNSNISKYFDEAKNYNTKQGTDLLQGILQQQVNSLASRNMLNSSVASTALGNATGEVLKNINNQNMQLGMQEAKAKTDLPSALGQLLQYGKVSTWSDPSVPLRNLLSLF